MVRVLPTEDDGNPMVHKRIARCAREAQISQTFLVREEILRKSCILNLWYTLREIYRTNDSGKVI
jgi:hypothetical protein